MPRSVGARIQFGRRFASLQPDKSGIELGFEHTDKSGKESVPVGAVVGADGAQSAVAQAAGWPKQPTVPLVQAIVKLPAGMARDTVRVWFIPDDTPYFYWLIPESDDRGVLRADRREWAGRRVGASISSSTNAISHRSPSKGRAYRSITSWVPVETRHRPECSLSWWGTRCGTGQRCRPWAGWSQDLRRARALAQGNPQWRPQSGASFATPRSSISIC